MTDSKPLLCIECRHCVFNTDDPKYSRCHHPRAFTKPPQDLVTGSEKHGFYAHCDWMRTGVQELCGPAGKLFEYRSLRSDADATTRVPPYVTTSVPHSPPLDEWQAKPDGVVNSPEAV